jgi:N-acetylmuramoyl-L-alanine amidase
MNNSIKTEPNRAITRAEFIKLLSIAHGYSTPVTVEKKFRDVPKTHTLINYINYGIAMGWINIDNLQFRPNDTISQGEIDKLIAVIKNTATANTVVRASDGVSRGKAASDIVRAFYSP